MGFGRGTYIRGNSVCADKHDVDTKMGGPHILEEIWYVQISMMWLRKWEGHIY